MAYTYEVVGRTGHMTEQEVKRNAQGDVVKVMKDSEYVEDTITVAATDTDTGYVVSGVGTTEAEAKRAADKTMRQLVDEHDRRREEARNG